MATKIAYGLRENIQSAIDSGVIPSGTLIVTSNDESELLFYDNNGNLKTVEERTRFLTLTEAKAWAKQYPCAGSIFTVQNGTDWLPYIVNNDGSLSPIIGGTSTVVDFDRIFGGTAWGI